MSQNNSLMVPVESILMMHIEPERDDKEEFRVAVRVYVENFDFLTVPPNNFLWVEVNDDNEFYVYNTTVDDVVKKMLGLGFVDGQHPLIVNIGDNTDCVVSVVETARAVYRPELIDTLQKVDDDYFLSVLAARANVIKKVAELGFVITEAKALRDDGHTYVLDEQEWQQ